MRGGYRGWPVGKIEGVFRLDGGDCWCVGDRAGAGGGRV